MPSRQLRLRAADGERLRAGLDKISAELEIPGEFPDDVRAEASAAASAASMPERDLTDVPFGTIDPPGSIDLEQAVHLSRDGSGFRVR